jgi:hypothetical protein
MGFMDSIFGGEESQTTSGFQNLPPEIRNAFTSFATQGTGLLGGGAGDAMFRPMGTTQDESSAFGMFRQGFAPGAPGAATLSASRRRASMTSARRGSSGQSS